MMMKTIDYPKTVVDPVITELRRHKQEIAAAFGFGVMPSGGRCSNANQAISGSRHRVPDKMLRHHPLLAPSR